MTVSGYTVSTNKKQQFEVKKISTVHATTVVIEAACWPRCSSMWRVYFLTAKCQNDIASYICVNILEPTRLPICCFTNLFLLGISSLQNYMPAMRLPGNLLLLCRVTLVQAPQFSYINSLYVNILFSSQLIIRFYEHL